MFTNKFDNALKELPHYKNFPQMLPFVGNYYANTRLLLVGESHYLSKNSAFENTPEKCYKSNDKNLQVDDIEHIRTRLVIKKFLEGSTNKAYRIFLNIEEAIKAHCSSKQNNSYNFGGKKAFEHLAFYNFFQRPAEKNGDSIIVKDLDVEKAEETFLQIVKTIEPKFVMFTSSKAYKHLSKDIKIDYKKQGVILKGCPHPSCKWWNKASNIYNGQTGKQKFTKFLQDNNIF